MNKNDFIYGYLLSSYNTKKKYGNALVDVELKHYTFSDMDIEEAINQYREILEDGKNSSMLKALQRYEKHSI